MAYGLSIYNASDTLIINQDYSNYHVVSSGSVANNSTTFPSWGAGELLYIRASTNGAVIQRQTQYEPPLYSALITRTLVSTGTLEYVIVKKTPTPSSSTHGLRVYQSNGSSIAFDSGRPAAKIVSSYFNAASEGGNRPEWSATLNQPFSVPVGRKRYISGQPFYYPATYGFDPSSGVYYAYNVLTWTSDSQQSIFGPGGADYQGTLIFLTIDI